MTLIDVEFHTDDIGAAETFLLDTYPTVRIEDTGRTFGLRQTIRGTDEVSASHFRYRSAMTIGLELESAIAIGFPLGGVYRCTSNGDSPDPGLPILFRPGRATSELSDLSLLAINIDLASLNRFAARQIGAEGGRLLFESPSPVSAALGRYWQRTAVWLSSAVLDQPEVLGNDLARAGAMDAMLGATLAAFPIRFVPVGTAPRSSTHRTLTKQARLLIEDRAAEAITTADVAAAVHVSVRTLQRAFVADFGLTPMAYLERVRLTAVREDLLAGDPAQVTVGSLARRWGFTHLGRFAARYRAAYGESPVETLRR